MEFHKGMAIPRDMPPQHPDGKWHWRVDFDDGPEEVVAVTTLSAVYVATTLRLCFGSQVTEARAAGPLDPNTGMIAWVKQIGPPERYSAMNNPDHRL